MKLRLISAALLISMALRGGRVSPQPWTEHFLPSAIKQCITLNGLDHSVTITYDNRGIPYIYAQSDDDLYFAQGYVVARDRLWQMDLLRRTGRGQLAEIFGPGAIEQDKIHRTYGFGQLAEQIVPTLDRKVRAAMTSYSRGVNAYISSLDDRSLPVEFRLLRYKPSAWLPSDCVIIGKLFAEGLSSSWQLDLVRAAFEDISPEKRRQIFRTQSDLDVVLVGHDESRGPPIRNEGSAYHHEALVKGIVDDAIAWTTREHLWLRAVGLWAKDLAASNNWVVSGKHSETGRPLLANDPHLPPSVPSIWYIVSLEQPGFHCEGVTAPGTPGVLIGHNDRVAWGVTNVGADVQDLFIERFDTSNPSQYLAPDGWRHADVTHEAVRVRKVPTDNATEVVSFDITRTRHGPIVLDKDGRRYALAWPALDPTSRELEVYYYIDHSRSCRDLERVLTRYSGFPLNFVYADTAGHIGWWAEGRYPIRASGRGSVPQLGWTGAGDWIGYVPLTETPHISDPVSGIIATANNRTIGTSFRYFLGDIWAPPYRARRIYTLLTAKKTLSVEDLVKIQGDTFSIPAARFASQVVRMASRGEAGSFEWANVLKELKGWNGQADASSRAMLLVFLMKSEFASQILEAAFGQKLAREYSWTNDLFFDELMEKQPAEWLPSKYRTYSDLILACYQKAVQMAKDQFGVDRSGWTWGEYAKARFWHPLSGVPFVGRQFQIRTFPLNGDYTTINDAGNVSMRFIADTSNWDNTRLGLLLGESGDPKSSHWMDQLEDWRNIKAMAIPFTGPAIERSAKEKVVLKRM